MIDFKQSVEQLVRDNTNMVFFNEGPQHASIVLEAIFEKAQDSLYIYSGSLSDDVINDKCIEILQNKLNKGLDIKVFVDDIIENIEDTDGAYRLLFNHIRQAPPRLVTILKDVYKKPCHFTIGDNSSYRIETNTEKYKATVNLNDPKTAIVFAALLKSYWV